MGLPPSLWVFTSASVQMQSLSTGLLSAGPVLRPVLQALGCVPKR